MHSLGAEAFVDVVAQDEGDEDAGDHDVAQAQHGEGALAGCIQRPQAGEQQLDGRIKVLGD